ncbi:unnamed protein product [Kuraishia capsulata CBS 1993]|uniref:Hyaluronan/mRNA-binding protein domain-containing protein n=1 Tax=Kuraishia capsulata CBS 1993 TaxID=1382522 RepID=W6MMY2_9ASCO|nr:uncharacterized protein KUCA_T00003931001 [Kuraishia capsulata CBS 1993]CDK27951.1 unnamed protein product [Kuraishia capsulata CBS 1993]
MARTNKWNNHHSSEETARYFTHNGHIDAAPNGIKKGGAGKNNWGTVGSEIDDLIDSGEIPPVFKRERRGSNHSQLERRFSNAQNQSSAPAASDDDNVDENDY